ncbi:hypothetical protein P8452_42904 [Trifolium repens]|nr:hypothetical protein P8452_42904 [Trifolium repens]
MDNIDDNTQCFNIEDWRKNMGPTTGIEHGTTHSCVAKWNRDTDRADITIKKIDSNYPFEVVRVSSSNEAVNNKASSTCERIEDANGVQTNDNLEQNKDVQCSTSVATSGRVIKQTEVTPLLKENQESVPKFANGKPYELYRFMGLYICKEHNGVKYLGTIFNYYLEMNLLKVQYKTDGRIEYLTPMEALYNMAKWEDFNLPQSAPSTR